MSLPLLSRPRSLSCGIVVLAPTRELLLCHVTGQHHWDLPKGGIHDGETPAEAAVRETMEETGLVFAPDALVDLGRFPYTGKKDLHLFAAPSERIDPLALCCESTFVERGSSRRLPEMDGFGWFAIDRLQELCTSRMAAVPFDKMAQEVPELVKKKGGTIVTITEAEAQRWEKTTEPVIEAWIKQVEDRNIDGGKLLETVRGLVAKHEKAA